MAWVHGTYAWWVRNDAAALSNYRKDLGESPEEAGHVLGRVPIPPEMLAELREDLSKQGIALN